ncbi:J domain-containing protein [Aestuariispira insulae]|uniref:DnaJ-like protein n=1 Tax=Aestuariispira insulae TaxID=1461337 RepID=A0A3D9H3S2_9PROT|nr:DnaJ domain-containing protein [Aestuariispira insulae]RED44135.1 DnaJ-like protein [Aestuariispira insulae]
MNIYDAARILGLSGELDAETIKSAYREAARKYHPDTNPAGADMMKMVNAAYDVLKDFSGKLDFSNSKQAPGDYPEQLNEALNSIIDLPGLSIEVCGAWAWVTGDTKTHKDALKSAKFKYASKKKSWYFRPEDYRSRGGNKSMDEIRAKYGSQAPRPRRRQALSATCGEAA